jgi:ribonuclease D
VDYQDINSDALLLQYCETLAKCKSIAFDTEFVSESTFRPVLCLVQVEADGQLAVIDALAITNMVPFWEVLAAPGHQTIVHAGRSETEFCIQAIGRPPANLFDVQLAAGFVGAEYPGAFGTLIAKFLGHSPSKHETRTDWLHRPLSKRQIEYALNDAHYLPPLHAIICERLHELGRMSWFQEEMVEWLADVERSLSQERWRRMSGIAGLDARALAIVRELYQWRENEAQRRDQPARRVLRDDLLIELARRGSSDVKRIHAVRGLERGDLLRRHADIAASIQRGLELPEAECPQRIPRDQMPQLSVLGQFLFAALGSICRQAHLAPNLVATPNDIRELIAYRTEHKSERSHAGSKHAHSDDAAAHTAPPAKTPPPLARGWRTDFVGRLFDDLLAGKMAIRISDPKSDHPLTFEERTEKE